jgi:hypothetical protein
MRHAASPPPLEIDEGGTILARSGGAASNLSDEQAIRNDGLWPRIAE